MRLPRSSTMAALSVALAGMAAAARAQPTPPHTKVSLLAETDAVRPGRPLHLAVRLQMEPGWHSYWRNPGDAGLPTRVRWTLPSGFEAGEVRWPYPQRFTQGPVGSYGYAREVLLLDEVRVPASPVNHEVRIGAHVDWLECQEACLPGKTDVSLVLPVRAAAGPGPDAAAFAEARGRLPVSDPAWRFGAATAAGDVVLTVTPPPGTTVSDASFFPVRPRPGAFVCCCHATRTAPSPSTWTAFSWRRAEAARERWRSMSRWRARIAGSVREDRAAQEVS